MQGDEDIVSVHIFFEWWFEACKQTLSLLEIISSITEIID